MPNIQQEPQGATRPEVVRDLVDRFDRLFTDIEFEKVLGKLPKHPHQHKVSWFERYRKDRAAERQAATENGGPR